MQRFYSESLTNKIDHFLLDKTRIISCGALRKLAHKTQVFSNESFSNDYHRTRLTHTIEVVHITSMIIDNLLQKMPIKLNHSLAEAIAFAHDMGHPPFGHFGENALNEVYDGEGFDHNAQVLRLLTQIERRSDQYLGLNLTLATLDGILKHNGKIDKLHPSIANLEELKLININKNGWIEAQVASIADDIAYCLHDLEDGLREKCFIIDDLLQFEIIKRFYIPSQDAMLNQVAAFRSVRENIILFLIDRLSDNVGKKIAQYDLRQSSDSGEIDAMVVEFTAEFAEQIYQIKNFLRNNLYDQKNVISGSIKGYKIIKSLFSAYQENIKLLPKNWFLKAQQVDIIEQKRIICDYIAGMTDRYALHEYKEIF